MTAAAPRTLGRAAQWLLALLATAVFLAVFHDRPAVAAANDVVGSADADAFRRLVAGPVLQPPLADPYAVPRTPATSSRSSAEVTDAGTSGPNISRLSATWTSSTSAPSVAAAMAGQMVPEWSESPTGTSAP